MARFIGKNLNLFTLGTEAHAAMIRECEIEIDADVQENRAIKDPWSYKEPGVKNWSITFSVGATSDVTYESNSKTNVTRLQNQIGSSFAVDVRSASGGTKYAGTGVLTRGRHSIPDSIQEGSYEIQGQGELVVTQL
jgi:hypothetical protein